MQSYDSYISEQENGQVAEQLLAALKECDERNEECWPVCSFDGKDADLEAEGCCGINALIDLKADTKEPYALFEIGGHKRFSPAREWDIDGLSKKALEVIEDSQTETVCGTGFEGEWEGDGWCLSTSDTLKVSLDLMNEDQTDFDYPALAEKIVKAAEEALASFRLEMKGADEVFDQMYRELLECPTARRRGWPCNKHSKS